MRHKSHKRLKTPRVAKSFSKLREEVNHNLNLSMFLEDARFGIMPIGGESDYAPNFAVEIHGRNSDEPRVLAILESLTRSYQPNWYSQRPIKKLLSDVAEVIASELVWEGRSVRKIFWDEKDGGVYRLHNFAYQWLFRAFGRYIRILPQTYRHPDDKIYDTISDKDTWDIVMPKKLGGYRRHRAMLKKLLRFPDIIPSFLKYTVSVHEWPTNFNAKHYAQETKLFIARATERWGWNQRDSNLENWSEFYSFYRTLTLNWAQAHLREHIVKELNQLFRRLDIEAEIVVKGLPTASEILRIRKQMCEGKISFMEAFKKCLV
ncbi:MAG: hypothetical protein OXN25_10545 [Candidatus Poribacteria bacterium]|nr:hypothetical protein [Candidatus Poribacteria bacterium]